MSLPIIEPHLHDFPPEVFGSKTDLLSEFGRSNDPIATMVTCWELGVIPRQVSHANKCEILMVQNFGGMVAAGANSNETISGSILYCVRQQSVKHLIVCGHTQCMTLAALLGGDAGRILDAFRDVRKSLSSRFEHVYVNRPEREWLAIIAQESVLLQLANLLGHQAIRSRLSTGSLRLHGWLRSDESSGVAAFDPSSAQFSD